MVDRMSLPDNGSLQNSGELGINTFLGSEAA